MSSPAPAPVSDSTAGGPVSVRLRGITKRFPGVIANDDVNLTCDAAPCSAIVGENGAGKSTLMKILVRRGAARRRNDRRSTATSRSFARPPTPSAAGIGHRAPALHARRQPHASGERRPRRRARLRRASTARAVRQLDRSSTKYGLGVDPTACVETSASAAGSGSRSSRCSTAGRANDHPRRAHRRACAAARSTSCSRRARPQAAGAQPSIFISHKLDEVLARRRRDHRHPARARPCAPSSHARVTARRARRAHGRLGAALAQLPRASTVTDEVLLARRARACRAPGRARRSTTSPSSSTAARCWGSRRGGQRPGRAGRVHHGHAPRRDRTHSVLGERRPHRPLDAASDARAASRYIPEDRHRHGLLLDSPPWENRVLGHQGRPPSSRRGLIDRAAARADTERIIEAYDVRYARARRARPRAVGRQPAEADRRDAR